MNTEQRPYIRHPSAIPLVVHRTRRGPEHISMHDVSLGGLAFEFPRLISTGIMVSVMVPSVADAELHGQIIWAARCDHGYIIGMAFVSEQDARRTRIVEQICHIEAYRREQLQRCGRRLSREDAAIEWINRNAAGFPLQDV